MNRVSAKVMKIRMILAVTQKRGEKRKHPQLTQKVPRFPNDSRKTTSSVDRVKAAVVVETNHKFTVRCAGSENSMPERWH